MVCFVLWLPPKGNQALRLYMVNPNTTESVGWEEARNRRGEHFNGLCIPRSRTLSLLLSIADQISGDVTCLVTYSYMTHFAETG